MSNLLQWQRVGNVQISRNKDSQDGDFSCDITPNPYRTLVVDEESNVRSKHVISKVNSNNITGSKRPLVVTKENTGNDNPTSYKTVKHRAGNSRYASTSKNGKKVDYLRRY